MCELVQVSDRCYYINCPAKIGIYTADGKNVYLIDSGSDKDAGRKVRQILEKNGWHLQSIRYLSPLFFTEVIHVRSCAISF